MIEAISKIMHAMCGGQAVLWISAGALGACLILV
jgi:hypothetical protein